MKKKTERPLYLCEKCKFAVEIKTAVSSRLRCHKYPPMVYSTNLVERTSSGTAKPFFATEFPVVHPDHWCGEFEVKGKK